MLNRTPLWALSLLCLAIATAASAGTVQEHDSIRAAARAHVLANADRFAGRVEVNVGELDARLALTACDAPLETYDSPNGLKAGRAVVGVRCAGSTPWKIYVPVNIGLPRKVVLTRRPLARGQTVQADDLWLAERDTARLHRAYYTDPAEVIGLRLRRAIGNDKVLHPNMLQRSTLVKRGSEVLIRAGGSGMLVQMKGTAMADGGRGDRIRVKNKASGRIVTGTVVASGIVEVAN